MKARDERIAKEKDRLAAILAAQQAAKAKAEELAAEQAKANTEAYNPPPATLSGCTWYHSDNYALNQIMAHESGDRTRPDQGGYSCSENGGGCFGLLQACPGKPLKDACGGNANCQISWFISNKANGRSWETIWALWQTQGWW